METPGADCGETPNTVDSESPSADDTETKEMESANDHQHEMEMDESENKDEEVMPNDSVAHDLTLPQRDIATEPSDETLSTQQDMAGEPLDEAMNLCFESDQQTKHSDSSVTPLIGNENKNTHRKTGTDMRSFVTYLKSLNEERLPETIPPPELDRYLSAFFQIVRKSDGAEYEPSSLRAILASIERYLRQKNYPASLTRDEEFSEMRKVLRSKQQMLYSLGKGQKTVAEQVVHSASAQEEKIIKLFQSHEMGPYTPNSIIFSLCFFICMYLKLRKSIEHKKLLWGDIVLCRDENNREYLTFSEQMLAKAQSQTTQRFCYKTMINAKIWAEPEFPDKDPVILYKFYAEKRPLTMNERDAPFYLGLNVISDPCQNWFRPAAMGVNKLNEIVRQVRDMTGPQSEDGTSSFQYTSLNSKDVFPTSELSSGSSSLKEEQNADSEGLDGKDPSPRSSPQLAIDVDGSYAELISMAHALDQPLSLVTGALSPKSPVTVKQEERRVISPNDAGAADGRDSFQHQVASMNVARVRLEEMFAQTSQPEESVSEEEDGGFIGVDQAKELVTDIIRRMDIMDMVRFDRWLKSMNLTRHSHTGQVICKDAVEGRGSSRKPANYHDNTSDRDSADTATGNINILLNISLNPRTLRNQGPISVQATTVSPTAHKTMLSGAGPQPQLSLNGCNGTGSNSQWNGNNDSPLDLALTSLRGTSGPASESHHSHRAGSTSSLAGAAGDCSPAKQQKRVSGLPSHLSSYTKPAANHTGAAVVTSSPSHRRKLNPNLVTHIRPRLSEGDTQQRNRRKMAPVHRQVNGNRAPVQYISVEDWDDDLVRLFNLKKEAE